MKNITHWAFLLASAVAAPAFGQDYVIPLAATNAATCGAPPFAVVTQSTSTVSCGRAGYFHWTAIGGGWSTGFTLSNPTGSDMAVQISLLATDGVTAQPAAMSRNGSSLGTVSTDTQVLAKHATLRYVLPSNGAATQVNGQVTVQVLAKDGLSLQSVQAVEDYTYTNAAGVVFSTVTLPVSWIDQAQSTYTATFEQNAASGSLGAFAVKDLSGSQAGQTVDVKAYDVNGTLLADKSVAIAAGAVQAYTAGDLLGAAAFQSLPSTPIARIIFTGTDRIDVLMLQVRGQSLAAVPSTAVLTQ